MKKLILATHNRHKCDELLELMKNSREVVSLDDINITEDIPETGNTFMENARQKAEYVRQRMGDEVEILADDSGLEVFALGGEPGVLSARYAGEAHNDNANTAKLLENLKNSDDRSARFVTVLAYMHNGQTEFFEGEVRGTIINECRGNGGFGYDPVFVPEGYEQTFAEVSAEVKNSMSHRGNAFRAWKKSLEE
ncbi:MAG: RdgB/HAM1 family non-canonical purine NTP pyrophosphatase [Paludibacteraceae bacterium]|nr:RdgB/HAM1 family non-canonical purine NTP pyrophosphatase [Paludibacteraceae bacterium]